MKSEQTISDLDVIKLMLDPRRFRIMKLAADEPVTVKQLAEKLEEKSSRLYYHVNKLEELGLLKLVETKQHGNLIEKYYQTDKEASRLYNIDPTVAQQNSGVIIHELSRITNQALRVIEKEIIEGKVAGDTRCTDTRIAYKSLTHSQWNQKLQGYYDVLSANPEDKQMIMMDEEEEVPSHSEEKEDYVFVMLSYRLKDAENL